MEIAVTSNGGRAVRDSKNPGGPSLHFTGEGWRAFLRGVEGGAFDS
ncbi:hypothetical protein JOF35_000321 [Streptomyces demainii]|uniref:DUF397 domain-containing protein n=1 Tax=Streptomyces demainii TaxID=588122 RepID=A0ABT9KI16_9ACTN|nr:hypothetical protein [Streptomyces demainii]